ncbi:NAD(+) synthase [[Mycoplasma] gypis]|uniref:NH(3)-dependent NAD(+) synthetase n=1 Tax=[Mycoplasma] gypis TaxID=92404 RepID=A0ABZ2RPZ5_9BACT|nr:NAD(+) synthase [[Mycoplasma] gypis]MBN0919365.1 NAD(+) synthase [[Mycoplasma] gypis]
MKIQNITIEELSKKYDINKYNLLIEDLVNWLKQQVANANAKGLVLGVSGGIDSATLAFICKKAVNENLHLYNINIQEDLNKPSKSVHDAKLIEKKLGHKIEYIELGKTFQELKKALKIDQQFTEANIKARLRMTSLYACAQQHNCLVVGTDNLNEYTLGYFTKYGDGGCDLLPIAQIKKSDIYIMAKILGVPQEVITKQPSADLWEDQSDEKELGFSYDDFESYYEDKKSVDSELGRKIQKQIDKNTHKITPIPIGPKLS